MRVHELVSATIQLLRKQTANIEGGFKVHGEMQRKGHDKALQAVTASLMHAFNINRDTIEQSATVDFLRGENARLWDVRQTLIEQMRTLNREANKLAAKGYVTRANELDRETQSTVGQQITAINIKIEGIRIALDHALHAGGDVFKTRAIQSVTMPETYHRMMYGSAYDKDIVNPLNTEIDNNGF
ncbi:hypothetical protein [Enterovibrio norvegicus]|uniref:hypothetical protein n=1 Tax=Enterovibrio norvegicus TaxID=188144 RepID=UPI000C85FF04|nr:hypothetical protein [Enterovibrio norvegicus]PMH64553.1 hypothetical protein BCU62_15980 [Enterovibrio norvegicus]